ncbi:serine/threonine-protein kinase [Streptomyces sp. cmx-4-9]|uniref:serine/threonine-protein kinase n=1 Tax=Streptomyces sp. cmx-4-9 TaxID=2790941 RepID=UPI00397EC044
MGTVWRARDEVLAREVAVKEVRAPAALPDSELQRMYRRLEREAWAAARISHRGVVTVYDVATEDGRPWIVMELVRGLSLADVLEAEGRLSPQRAAHLGEQVLAALRSAHEAGVLHRDVKPGNVLVANDGRVVLSDFGIASLEGSAAITMTGEVVGSPEYLAPERALGRDPGAEADLWALGAMLYAAVEGTTPFRRDSPLATLQAVVEAEPPPPRRAGPLAPVLEGLLRKDPAERLSAAEAARMLRVVGAGGTVHPAGGPGPDTPAAVAHPGHEPHGGGTRSGAGAGGAAAAAAPGYGGPSPASVGGAAPPRGRAALVLAVGAAFLLLALSVLVWLLLKDRADTRDDGGAPGPGPAASSPAGGSGAPGPAASASASTSASASADGGQQVVAYVDAVRTSFTGNCPPAEGRAPAFAATVEVERVPAVLEYRWATRSGRTSGPGWQTVTYETGGPRSRRLEHSELTHVPGSVHRDAVRLEVRAPVELATSWVETSVACEKVGPSTPAPSTSGSAGPSAAPSASASAGVSPEASPEGTPPGGSPDPSAGGGPAQEAPRP